MTNKTRLLAFRETLVTICSALLQLACGVNMMAIRMFSLLITTIIVRQLLIFSKVNVTAYR